MSITRLVTQFDDGQTRATVATPTCSSCCCCCCCAASLLTTSTVTAMNIHELGKQHGMARRKVNFYVVGSIFILPIAAAIGIASTFVVHSLAVAVFLVSWILLLKVFYKRVGLSEPSKVIGLTVGVGSVFFVGEFFGGAALLFSGLGDGSGSSNANRPLIYLVLAPVLAFVCIRVLRKLSKHWLVQQVPTAPQGSETALPTGQIMTNQATVYPKNQTPHAVGDDQNDNSTPLEQPPKFQD